MFLQNLRGIVWQNHDSEEYKLTTNASLNFSLFSFLTLVLPLFIWTKTKSRFVNLKIKESIQNSGDKIVDSNSKLKFTSATVAATPSGQSFSRTRPTPTSQEKNCLPNLNSITKDNEVTNGIFDRENTDVLKGFSMLLIVFSHLAGWARREDLPFMLNMGYVGVCSFLLISGYGLSLSVQKKGLDGYFTKRFRGIFWPFIITNLVWVFLYAQTGLKEIKYQEWPEWILGLVNVNDTHWFLYFLFLWYIIFYCVEKYGAKLVTKEFNYKNLLYFVLPVILIIGNYKLHYNAYINILSFPLGVLIANYKPQFTEFLGKARNAWAIFISGFVIYFYNAMGDILNTPLFRSYYPIFEENWLRYIDFKTIFLGILAVFWLIYKPFRGFILACIFGLLFASRNLPEMTDYIIFNLSAIGMVLGFMAIYNLFMKDKFSVIYQFLGVISFEIYLLHDVLLHTFDFVLFRGDLIYTFPVYLLLIITLSFLFNKFLRLIKVY